MELKGWKIIFEEIAKESVTIESEGKTIRAYSSELATLRLFHHYHDGGKILAGFDQRRGKHFFAMVNL